MAIPTSTGARVDFTDPQKPLPNAILLDTNILINVLYSGNLTSTKRIIRDSRTFFARLRNSGKTGLVTHLSLTEYFHFLTIKRIEAFTGKTYSPNIYKTSPNIILDSGVNAEIQDFLNTLRLSKIVVVAPEDLAAVKQPAIRLEIQTKNYMMQLNMLSNDAYILAIADRLGIKNIASADKDFLRARNAGFNIYTSPNLR